MTTPLSPQWVPRKSPPGADAVVAAGVTLAVRMLRPGCWVWRVERRAKRALRSALVRAGARSYETEEAARDAAFAWWCRKGVHE